MLIVAPASGQPRDDAGASFEERFVMGGVAPTFTRPEIVALLSGLDTSAPGDEIAAWVPAGDADRREPAQPFGPLAIAEPKGPAKILKDLITTPITELLFSRAEAGPDAPPPEARAAPVPSDAAAIPVRAADPMVERPPADAVAAAPTRLATELAQPGPAGSPADQAPERRGAETLAAAPAVQPAAAPRAAETEPSRSGPAGAGGRRIASGRGAWYEHPGRTASGEIFDPRRLTAAHHILPFGTTLRVVNEASGRSVVVRVNDRIPRKTRIVIDLSRAGAKAIGLAGVGRVSLYRLDPATTAGITPASARADRIVRTKAKPPEPAQAQTRARSPAKIVAMQRP
jgi:rare lipoprotein A (peptidoglycan hydrolase)